MTMQPGLFSVSYAGLWGQASLPVEDFIAKAAELGYPAVLLAAKRPHLSVLDADRALLGRVADALKRHGLSLIGLACYNDILMRGPAEVPVREMQLAYIDRVSEMAAELGGPLVRIFTGYSRGPDGYAAEWNQVVDFLGEAADRAARRGVTLAVQNHHDLAVETSSLELLLDELDRPNLKAGFDAWSPFLRGEDLYAAARRMAGRTAITIAANYRRYPRFSYVPALVNYRREETDIVRAVAMSEGEIDYKAFFRGLRDGGFAGPAIYEMCSPLAGGGGIANLDAKATDFLAYMKTLGD